MSRELTDSVVHGLAKVGLVWALAVLGTVFVVSAAYGADPGAYAHAAAGAAPPFGVDAGKAAPRTIGLALTLLVLAAGLAVLAVAASRGRDQHSATPAMLFVDPAPPAPASTPDDLALAVGLGLSA